MAQIPKIDVTKVLAGTVINTIIDSNNSLDILANNAAEVSNNAMDIASLSIFENKTNNTSTIITHTAANNVNQSFTATNIASINIIIPSNFKNGDGSLINFRSSAIAPIVTFTNNSLFDLRINFKGIPFENYRPNPNKISNIGIFCDGMLVTCSINEV